VFSNAKSAALLNARLLCMSTLLGGAKLYQHDAKVALYEVSVLTIDNCVALL